MFSFFFFLQLDQWYPNLKVLEVAEIANIPDAPATWLCPITSKEDNLGAQSFLRQIR